LIVLEHTEREREKERERERELNIRESTTISTQKPGWLRDKSVVNCARESSEDSGFKNRERCFHLKVEDTDQKSSKACLNAKSRCVGKEHRLRKRRRGTDERGLQC
jgi:hypothetical protein